MSNEDIIRRTMAWAGTCEITGCMPHVITTARQMQARGEVIVRENGTGGVWVEPVPRSRDSE